MAIKVYQPHRKDLLINTDWGIPKNQFSKEEAKGLNLVLFKGRWVNSDERIVLKDQYNAYRSIRAEADFILVMSFLSILPLLFIAFIAAFLSSKGEFSVISELARQNIREFVSSILLFCYGIVGIIGAIGLFKYRRWGRNFATIYLIPLSLATLIALLGLYYMYRKTAREIFKETPFNSSKGGLP